MHVDLMVVIITCDTKQEFVGLVLSLHNKLHLQSHLDQNLRNNVVPYVDLLMAEKLQVFNATNFMTSAFSSLCVEPFAKQY